MALKSRLYSRDHWERLADALAVALVVSLPWSTSATSILAVLWLISVLPTLERTVFRRVISSPAGGLPLLLWVLAVAGMLWATDVPWAERLEGLKSYHKLLLIPLLIVQFQRSSRADLMVKGFLASCTVLLAASWANYFVPTFPWISKSTIGVPVKDYIAQSSEFAVCIFLIAGIALRAWRLKQYPYVLTLSVWAMLFVSNIIAVATSRSVLVIFPVLLLVFSLKYLGWKGAVAIVSASIALAAVAWTAPQVRDNVTNLLREVREFDAQGDRTRAGERLVFWTKSIEFVSTAPLIGHGTGSIRDQFRNSVVGQNGMAALASSNPHNQVFAVAIQLGLLGTIVLFATWLAHFMAFSGGGFAAWAGLVIVTQNFVGSLFNSFLFDFTSGWGYVIGVGVAAGVVFKNAHRKAAPPSTAP